MSRALMCIFLACAHCPLSASDYAFRIQSEFRRDAVDFEEETKEFYRQKLKIRFSEQSEANAAYVYDRIPDSSSYTWNIFLRDISPHVSFFAGHFYANFGKGMLLGKRSPFQADAFSRSGEMFSGKTITPAASGNPYFAFNGGGISLAYRLGDVDVRLSAFHSIKERYISQSEFESKSTASSVWSLENYDSRAQCRIEPVGMHTSGANASFALYRLFFLDIYGIHNAAYEPFGDEITLRYGVHAFKGFGFTALYRDEFLTIFSEIASSFTRYRNKEGNESNESGSASLSGISLRAANLKASFAYKSAEADFFSPYTATIGEYIGPGLFLDVVYMPIEKLNIGSSISSEKKSAPASTDDEIPSIRRERVFCEYAIGWLYQARMEYARAYRSTYGTERYRYRGSIALGDESIFLCAVSGTYQTNNLDEYSYCATASLSIFVRKTFSMHVSMTHAEVSENNSLYEYLLPMKHTRIPGTFIRQSGNLYAAKCVFARWGIYLSCRGITSDLEDGTRAFVFEAFASGQF